MQPKEHRHDWRPAGTSFHGDVVMQSVPCFRELEKCIAPVSRHIRKLAGKACRGREKRGWELQRVEHRNGVLELFRITVVERQQRGGAGGQGRSVQPFRELRQGKHAKPTLRESGHLVGKPLTASDLVIAEDQNVR